MALRAIFESGAKGSEISILAPKITLTARLYFYYFVRDRFGLIPLCPTLLPIQTLSRGPNVCTDLQIASESFRVFERWIYEQVLGHF